MTPEYIMRKSLCREPSCAVEAGWWQTAESCIDNLTYAPAYAEPGYEQPRRGILFSDWNYFPRELGGILERAGYAVEWEDEWGICGTCGKAFRTNPDCFSWQPFYIDTNYGVFCRECLTECEIETLENDPGRALKIVGTL